MTESYSSELELYAEAKIGSALESQRKEERLVQQLTSRSAGVSLPQEQTVSSLEAVRRRLFRGASTAFTSLS